MVRLETDIPPKVATTRLDEILTHWGEDVEEHAGLHGDGPMDGVGGHEEAVALLEALSPSGDGHVEDPCLDKAALDVRVRVRRGSQPLSLRFALRSGPATSSQTLTLARR